MFGRVFLTRDPFEGTAARRRHLRVQLEGAVALALAIAACGLTTAMWLQTLGPLFDRVFAG